MTAHLTPGNRQTHELLQKLWTKAVGTPDYDKEEWKALERAVGFQAATPHVTTVPERVPWTPPRIVPGSFRCAACASWEWQEQCRYCAGDEATVGKWLSGGFRTVK
jgi:hypothetical protein